MYIHTYSIFQGYIHIQRHVIDTLERLLNRRGWREGRRKALRPEKPGVDCNPEIRNQRAQGVQLCLPQSVHQEGGSKGTWDEEDMQG